MMKSIAVAIAFFFAMSSLPSVAQPRYDYGPGGNPYPRTYPGPPRGTRTGQAMSMPRLERRSLPATGLPSASGTGRAGRSAACESAASIKLGLPALLFDLFPRMIVGLADNYRHPHGPIGL